jgi:hypothetical protein
MSDHYRWILAILCQILATGRNLASRDPARIVVLAEIPHKWPDSGKHKWQATLKIIFFKIIPI